MLDEKEDDSEEEEFIAVTDCNEQLNLMDAILIAAANTAASEMSRGVETPRRSGIDMTAHLGQHK